jgi:predicted ATPase
VRHVELNKADDFDTNRYPFSIPAIATMGRFVLDRHVTILVGENGSGKSTLVEAIAVAAGINPEGGSKNFNFATSQTHSLLGNALRIARGAEKERDGFFLRAESFYNVSSELDRLREIDVTAYASYGGRSLHQQSHGESFLATIANRLGAGGFYVFDEPESALSPSRQLAMLQIIHRLCRERASQIVMATHSPILMAYPGATIYELSSEGIQKVDLEDTDHYRLTRAFLLNRETFLHQLGVL